VPAAALVDYELTLTAPYRLTADTGLDSLTHGIEAYVSRKANPHTDMLALNAIRLIYRNIRQACRTPDDREAREAMMLAATQAGLAFSNASVALVHGMSRPIGAFFHVPHGLSNAMLLPAVTAFSVEAAPQRYADCARAMGVADAADPDPVALDKLLDALRGLNQELKVPSPKVYGIDEKRFFELMPTMAQQALASGSPNNNPRIPTVDEIVALYKQAWA
jgi:alcohol dehydrogenase class IV